MENLPKWKEVFSLSNFILLVLYQSLIFSKDGFSGLAYSLAYRKASMEKIKKILLIDDEESTLRAFENVLLLNGFDCFATSDIELGICTYQKYEFDCVLLDYQMPCKNGIEVMSDILCLNHNAKVIIYTGQTDISIKQTAMLKGAYNFLYKPIDFRELMNIMINEDQYSLEMETI